jgi:hypothetical protein
MRFYRLLLFTALQVIAEPRDRISRSIANLSLPQVVYVSPGLVSLIEFPQNIIEVRVGNPKSLKAVISQVSPKELTIYLASSASQPSNLIVRSEKRVFVFDIVPSKSNHQDYVKISGSFSGIVKHESNKVIAQDKISFSSKGIQKSSVYKSLRREKVGP